MSAFEKMTARDVAAHFGLLDEINPAEMVGTDSGRWLWFGVLTFIFLFLLFFDAYALICLDQSIMFSILSAFEVLAAFYIVTASVTWVRDLEGRVTSNFFTGMLRAYGPGLHPKYPWEFIKSTVSFQLWTEAIVGTFFTKDGVQVTYTVVVRFVPRLKLLPLFVQSDSAQRTASLTAVIRAVLAREIASRMSPTLHHGDSVQSFQDALTAVVDGDEGQAIQARYGTKIEGMSLSEPTFSQHYIDATTSQVVAEKVREAAQRFREMGTSADSAVNSALILNDKESVRRNITTIEGADISNIIAAALAALGNRKSTS